VSVSKWHLLAIVRCSIERPESRNFPKSPDAPVAPDAGHFPHSSQGVRSWFAASSSHGPPECPPMQPSRAPSPNHPETPSGPEAANLEDSGGEWARGEVWSGRGNFGEPRRRDFSQPVGSKAEKRGKEVVGHTGFTTFTGFGRLGR